MSIEPPCRLIVPIFRFCFLIVVSFNDLSLVLLLFGASVSWALRCLVLLLCGCDSVPLVWCFCFWLAAQAQTERDFDISGRYACLMSTEHCIFKTMQNQGHLNLLTNIFGKSATKRFSWGHVNGKVARLLGVTCEIKVAHVFRVM